MDNFWRLVRRAVTILSLGALAGCAVPIIGALTLNELSSGTSFISTGLAGKSLGEHGLDLVTGEDCRVIEGTLRSDRKLCEDRDAPATDKDFKGLIGMLGDALGAPPSEAELTLRDEKRLAEIAGHLKALPATGGIALPESSFAEIRELLARLDVTLDRTSLSYELKTAMGEEPAYSDWELGEDISEIQKARTAA